MTEVFSEIEGFISNALTCLNSYFKNGIKTNEIEIDEVYPYLFRDYETKKILYKGENVFEDLGILYESLIPISLKKDFGLFYTREDTILKMMVDSVEVLSGEILEPACGSGLFLVKIIEKIVLELKLLDIFAILVMPLT